MSQHTTFTLNDPAVQPPRVAETNGALRLPPVLQDPVQRLLRHLKTGAPRTMVGLVGLPGAGKTTVASQWGNSVNLIMGQKKMVVLGMDGFHLSKAALQKLSDPKLALQRRGAPWTFDTRAMAQRLKDLRQISALNSVWWPEFEHEVGDPIDKVHEIPASAHLILVEGW